MDWRQLLRCQSNAGKVRDKTHTTRPTDSVLFAVVLLSFDISFMVTRPLCFKPLEHVAQGCASGGEIGSGSAGNWKPRSCSWRWDLHPHLPCYSQHPIEKSQPYHPFQIHCEKGHRNGRKKKKKKMNFSVYTHIHQALQRGAFFPLRSAQWTLDTTRNWSTIIGSNFLWLKLSPSGIHFGECVLGATWNPAGQYQWGMGENARMRETEDEIQPARA